MRVCFAATPGCWSFLRVSPTRPSRGSPAATDRTVSPWSAGGTREPRRCFCALRGSTPRGWWASSSPPTPPLQVEQESISSAFKSMSLTWEISESVCTLFHWLITFLLVCFLVQGRRRPTPPVWSRRNTCRPSSAPCLHTTRAAAETHSADSHLHTWAPPVSWADTCSRYMFTIRYYFNGQIKSWIWLASQQLHV